MAKRELSVKFDTQGFKQAIDQLKQTGKAFDSVLKSSQEASRKAAEAFKRATGAGDAKGAAEALRAQENAAKAAARAIAASYRELGVKSSESLNRLRAQAVAAFEAIKNSGTASARDIAIAQEALNRKLKDLDDQLGGVQRTANQTGSSFIGLKTAIAGAVVAIGAGLTNVGREAISAGSKFEQFRIALNTFLGSRVEADKLIKQIGDFAASTPFELPEIQKASQRLLAFGTEANKIIPTLRRIGDVSAGVSAPIAEIAEIYGKARVAGRLFADDINQLTGRGIPIIGELAKQFKVSEGEVKKLVENGKVGFKNLEQAFVALTSEGGKFYNLMQAQSESTGGRISNLSDRFTALKVSIFDALQPQINAIIDALIKNFDGLQNSVNQVIAVFKLLAQNGNTVIAVLTALATALAVRVAVQALSAAITALSAALVSAGGAAGLFRVAIAAIASPANLAAVGIGVLAGALIKFSLDAKQARQDALNLTESLKALGEQNNNQALTDLDKQEANARSQLVQVDQTIARLKRQIGEFAPFERSGGNLSNVAASLRQELIQAERQRADIVNGLSGVASTRARIQGNIIRSRQYGPEVPAGFGQKPTTTTTTTTATTSSKPAKTPKARNARDPQNEAERLTQRAINNRMSVIDDWQQTQSRLVADESANEELDLKLQLVGAESDRKELLESALKLHQMETAQTLEQLRITAELVKAGDTITILEGQRRKLGDQEIDQLAEAKRLRTSLTQESDISRNNYERELKLEQERIRVYEQRLEIEKQQRLDQFRGDVDRSLNPNDDARLKELADLIDRARELGDTRSLTRLESAVGSLTVARQRSLEIQVTELENAVKLSELKGDELAIAQQLNELQEQYDQRRLDIQTLIFQAIQDGNLEAIKTLEDLLERTDDLKKRQEEQVKSQFDFIKQLSETVKESAAAATEQALSDLFTLSKSLGDILRDFATSVLRSIAQMAAQAATKAIFKAIGLGFADGGLVRGPGTGRSDSIPARLSNGEFVMSADSVRYWGSGFMDSINSMRSPNVAYAGASGGGGRGGAVIINQNISTPDANSFRRSESQIGRSAGEQLRRAVQRNG